MNHEKHKSALCLAQDDDLRVIQAAYKTWLAADKFRNQRSRNKSFAYGRQWNDLTTDENGNSITEGKSLTNHGCNPITNNLIRQMVKAVIGRFRTNQMNEKLDESVQQVYRSCQLHELDSRALEEFLISGCTVQRVDIEERLLDSVPRVENVNLSHFFVNSCFDCRGWDEEIVGQLHDLSLAELVRRVSGGNRSHAEAVRRIYSHDVDGRIADFTAEFGADSTNGVDFWRAPVGKCRAIEVWTLESMEVLVCHDRSAANVQIMPYGSAEAKAMQARDDVSTRWDIAKVWRCRWYSPMGDLLCSYLSPYRHGGHPFVVKMYPMIDGEVHSLVEDVIDQQKYVNRLITMLDHIMNTSAKGVLLFPVDAIPEGFSWRDIRKVWASADGVLPFSERDCDAKPEQIVGKPNDLGAYQMINLQMKLFEYVSGVNGSLQGRHQGGQNSSSLYENEVSNGEIAISDLIYTFKGFLEHRDRMLALL